jgi:hypothetical protein
LLLACCVNKLHGWGKRKRVKFEEEIDECVEMVALRDNREEVKSKRCQECFDRHATLLVIEEGFWKQRAKIYLLQEGDFNTRFFHMSTLARSKKKRVTKLVDEVSTKIHTREDLCEIAKLYFDTLLKNKNGIHEPVLNLI